MIANDCTPRFGRRASSSWVAMGLLAGALAGSSGASAAEKVALRLPTGQTVRADVVTMTRSEVTIKLNDKEQSLPLAVLSPKEVFLCWQQIDKKDPNLRVAIGQYLIKKALVEEGESELKAALKQDPALRATIEPLLGKKGDVKVAVPPETATVKKEPAKKEPAKEPTGSPADGAITIEADAEDILARMRHVEVPPRSPAEMKQFLDTRLKELKDKIGGDWRMIETPHFYCFANITPAQHQLFAQYNEGLYSHLQVVLRHTEGDKLWNNKCPVYYFDSYARFQKFAVEIDQMPGAANSGGYFSARGREAHICIPFMNGRAGVDKSVEEMALSTLKHEGTHAFLQLTGETVTLTKWMHEGMAQFIEFFPLRTTDKPSREREQRAMFLARIVKSGEIPSWEEMKNRPASGGDLVGYSFAWAKVEFLYRNFDNQRLPNLIRAIKGGLTEDQAMEKVFGMPLAKLEAGYHIWLKEHAKRMYRF